MEILTRSKLSWFSPSSLVTPPAEPNLLDSGTTWVAAFVYAKITLPEWWIIFFRVLPCPRNLDSRSENDLYIGTALKDPAI